MAIIMSRALVGLNKRTIVPFKLVLQHIRNSSFLTSARINEVFDIVNKQLHNAEIPEPETSAGYLLSFCLSSSNHPLTKILVNDWAKYKASNLSPDQALTLERLIQCRLARMPIQYIIGNWDFHSITLKVRPPVFIPRPETEQLVDLILSNLPSSKPRKMLKLLEIGPGSGAISLSLLSNRKDLNITCVERSKRAIDLTLENAELLKVSDRIDLLNDRVESGKAVDGLDAKYDMVFSNPPYVLRKDLMDVAPEISVYEDLRALDGGSDGLDVIIPILELAGNKLEKSGLVVMEVDPCHPYILPPKLKSLGLDFEILHVVKDLRGNERFMIFSKL